MTKFFQFSVTGMKRPFGAKFRQEMVDKWLRTTGRAAQRKFREGMTGAHSGRIYRRKGGRSHQASAPGEFPATDSGALLKSAKLELGGTNEVTFGTTAKHALYLRRGTSRMKRRRMSDDAMREASQATRSMLRGWVRWQKL